MSDNLQNREEQYFVEATEKETNQKCPNCGATVRFDPSLGKTHCEYCGYSCELPETDNENDICEHDFESALHTESFNWGEQKKSVECKQCGAVSIYDALETAAECPFCGSTSVMPAANDNTIAPGAVCPFSVPKEKASEKFTTWLKKKWFAPRKAKKNAQPEAFQGVYLPYWTYDAQTSSSFTAQVGYDRRVKDSNGNTKTETTWKHVNGVYEQFIDDETVMASKRHSNSIIVSCEPFDFSQMVPYSPQVMAGFIAERYSLGLKEGWEKAQNTIQSKLRNEITQYARSHWSADRVSSVKFSTHYSDITYKYLLVPVWISSFKYKDKVYQFAVNGQTGKVGGKAPVSAMRVIAFIGIIAGIIAGLVYLLK